VSEKYTIILFIHRNNKQIGKLKVRLYTARMRTRSTRTQTRTRLLSCFAFQIEHEPERGKLSTVFKTVRLFLAVRDKIWSIRIMAQIEWDTQRISLYSICTQNNLMICNLCLLGHIVHDSSQSWRLACPFFSKHHKQNRLTLVHSFFLERPFEHVSICGNDAKEVLGDWLIVKMSRTKLGSR